jgi:Family of unknown function (DUF6166)
MSENQQSNPHCGQLAGTTKTSPHSPDAIYYGSCKDGAVSIIDEGSLVALNPRHDLRQYSDTLRWGREDGGALQLSLALLAEALDSDYRAVILHERFAETVIARFCSDSDWMLNCSYIEQAAIGIESSYDLNWIPPAEIYLEEAIT